MEIKKSTFITLKQFNKLFDKKDKNVVFDIFIFKVLNLNI